MKVGIVIGRFQVPNLHSGHVHLINSAMEDSDELIIFIGEGKESFTKRDPFPAFIRRKMIRSLYPTAKIYTILDKDTDEEWVKLIDEFITKITDPEDDIVMYGSRDSFIDTYKINKGKYQCEFVAELKGFSGTQIRESVANTIVNSSDFRRGIMYAIQAKLLGEEE